MDYTKSEIDELYGVDISPSLISRITYKVMETAIAWQNKDLDSVYPILYLDTLFISKLENSIRLLIKLLISALYSILNVIKKYKEQKFVYLYAITYKYGG